MSPKQKYLGTGVFLVAVLIASVVRIDANAADESLAEFDDWKFGMFIHWGIYSVPAGRWDGEYVPGIGEWIQFRRRIPNAEYATLAESFHAEKYSPSEWAGIAADAGMKYLVITAKHHDGFAMFDSAVSDYDVVDRTPFGQDVIKSLSEAVRNQGIQFGVYYSQDIDWHEPGGRGNDWDFPGEKDPEPYVQGKALPQIDELMSGYGDIALLWFDTPGSLSPEQAQRLRDSVKERQPRAIVNSRIGHGLGDYFQTGDNAIPLQVFVDEGKWEVPATINETWGFKTDDHNWKESRDLIAKMVDIVSKGGNYLLNVGPDSSGRIPEPSVDVLRAIGDWLDVNGESIYATEPCPFFYTGVDWRCTTAANTLYIQFLEWPGAEFELAGLQANVKGAELLSGDSRIEYEQDDHRVRFTMPQDRPGEDISVLKVRVEQEHVAALPGYRSTDIPPVQDLFAWSARFLGEGVEYDWSTKSATNLRATDADGVDNQLLWYPYGILDGDYCLEVTYALDGEVSTDDESNVVVSARSKPWHLSPEDSIVEIPISHTGGRFDTAVGKACIEFSDGLEYLGLAVSEFPGRESVRIQKLRLHHQE